MFGMCLDGNWVVSGGCLDSNCLKGVFKVSVAGQVGTDQFKTEQFGTGHFRKGENGTGQVRTGQVRTGSVCIDPIRTGQIGTGQAGANQLNTGQVQVKFGKVNLSQDWSRPKISSFLTPNIF